MKFVYDTTPQDATAALVLLVVIGPVIAWLYLWFRRRQNIRRRIAARVAAVSAS